MAFLDCGSSLLRALLSTLILVSVLVLPAITQTPVGHWTFEEESGVTVNDVTGRRLHGTLLGGPPWTVGKIGGAISARAADRQYVKIPPVDLHSTRAVTVSIWVKQMYSPTGQGVLFEATPDYSRSKTGFALFADDQECAGMRASLRGDIGDTTNCYAQPSSADWHHIAVVYNKTQTAGSAIQLFVDGVLQPATRSLHASTNVNTFGGDPIYLFSRAGAALFDTATADELAIFDRALTATQIQDLCKAGTLVSIALSPASASVTEGSVQQFAARGTYADGSTRDLSKFVRWSSNGSSVATITGRGLVTAVGEGTTTLTAALERITGSAGLIVTSPGESQRSPRPGNKANFSISAAPSSLSIAQGNQGTATITTAVIGGFRNAVSLSASGVPSGTTVNFSPVTIASPGAGTSTLTLNVGTMTAAGSYSVTVTGSGGGLQRTTVIKLTVTVPNFTISASPASLTVVQGNQGNSSISTTVSGGFNSSIALSASGLPTGTTVSFAPSTIAAPGSGNSVLTLTVGTSTPVGTYNITVMGNGGGLQRTTTIGLTVTAQVAPPPEVVLSWTASVDQVSGYNVYSSTNPNGPYTMLNTSLIVGTNYVDQTVQHGMAYYYVATAVDAVGQESAYSNQATATVP